MATFTAARNKKQTASTMVNVIEYVTQATKTMLDEGYQVTWTDNRKHITFACPNGRKCRDSSLHDETFLKENLETLFAYRQATGFRPITQEPDDGWMGELASGLVQLDRSIEQSNDLPPSSSAFATHLDRQQATSSGGTEKTGDGAEALQRPRSKLAANMVACQKLL